MCGREEHHLLRLITVVSALFVSITISGVAFAQGATVTPSVPGDTVPTWVFYWVLGLSTFVGSALLLVIKTLWAESRKTSILTEDERTWLRELHQGRSDVPKAWSAHFDELEERLKHCHAILQQLVSLIEKDKVDLQQQLKDRLDLHDRQQSKMLRLAVRVQRAVEALAGLAPPDIESDLGDDDGKGES